MEEIEVNIKLKSNNNVYNLPIRKSDTITKLKEFCQKLSNIPPSQQNLLYKGKILLDEKLIKEYAIENNHDIILVEKKKQKTVSSSLQKNSDYSKNNAIINIKKFTDNKEINYNEVIKWYEQISDILPFIDAVDFEKVNNFYKTMGLGNFPEIFGIKKQELNEALKEPSFRDSIKNISKNPSLLKTYLNDPETRNYIQNNPILKLMYLNPQVFLSPQNAQRCKNIFKVDEKKIFDSSNTGIFAPPEPFESLNYNQKNQIMNSSGISNINSFNNNNSIEIKETFGNSGIDINYKETYKDKLSQLKDMGFINEERNLQALKQSKGNFNNAIENLLKYN